MSVRRSAASVSRIACSAKCGALQSRERWASARRFRRGEANFRTNAQAWSFERCPRGPAMRWTRDGGRLAQQHGIVVRLQRRAVGLGKADADRVERRSDVRPVEIRLVAAHEIADRIDRVVRNRKRQHGERPDVKRLSVLEADERRLVQPLVVGNRLGRHRVREDGNVHAVQEALQPRDVVRMVVRDEDGAERREVERRLQALAADAAVNQERRPVLLDEVGVSLGTRCNRSDAHRGQPRANARCAMSLR